jgi:hypothetical protein
LQISQRRTRREEQLPEIRSVLNRRDINRWLDIVVPYSLKSTHFHNPGLTSKPMFTRTGFSSQPLAVGQSCKVAFPMAPSNFERITVSKNSGSVPTTFWKNFLAHIFAPIVSGSSRNSFQPRPLVVQALQKV